MPAPGKPAGQIEPLGQIVMDANFRPVREGVEADPLPALPENQKTALILRYLDDLPPPAVAEVMGLSLKAVESLLQRAKQNLEKKLEGTR